LKVLLKDIFIHCLYFLVRIFSKRNTDFNFGNVLIIAPHPDDEIFGLGGLVLKMRGNGVKISLIYLTDGEGSGVWHDKEEIGRQRIKLSEKVAARMGIIKSDINRLHLPDGAVPHLGQTGFEEAVKNVKEILDIVKPDAVFATHPIDYWPFDHVACADITKEAVRQSEMKPQLWYYWVWAWYNIRPRELSRNSLKRLQKIDIGAQIPGKKAFMETYLNAFTSEGKPWSGIIPVSLIHSWEQPIEIIEKAE
jgi:LmbE family N-acetylglucosaminyl deacetylase